MPKLGIKKTDFLSLTVTLTIAFLVLSIAVLLFAGSLETYFNFRNQQKIIIYEQQLIAQKAAGEVKNFIEEKLGILKRSAVIGSLANASQEDQKLVLEKLLGEVPSFRRLILFNSEQQESANVSRLSEITTSKFTEQLKNDVFSSLKQEETYIGPIYIDEMSQEPMIILASPVKNVFGDLKGVLTAEVNLKFIWDLVGNMKIGQNGLAYVVDKKGNLIAFGDISRALKGENIKNLTEVNEFINNEEVVSTADIVKGIQGTNVVSTFVPLGRPDWAVIIELPLAEAYSSIIQMLKLSLWIILANLILAIATGFYLSKIITKPIINLRDAARKMSLGNLDIKIETKYKDEIGELAADFINMTEKLKESRMNLEAKVIERTSELKKTKEQLELKVEEMERFHKLTMGREEKILELKKKIRELGEELEKNKQKI
jgi:methyl-accepting chemotaxis protein